jgi:ATP/maltotriose-dependent transcriptional regulator MalT
LGQDNAVDDFLALASAGPAALVIEGEAGIGKTTRWLAVIERARGQGFRVLSARAAATESVLAYATLADLLAGSDLDAPALPDPQRIALDRVLLRAEATGPATNQHAVSAAFLSVIEALAAEAPVLMAIDDLQWLDPSSLSAVAFAARRLAGPVSVLATVRTEPGIDNASWLQLPRPDAIRRIGMAPLSLGVLHAVISERLGQSFPRPTMVRIHQISGGNPFYALELARAAVGATTAEMVLPGSLSELVRARIDGLALKVQEALLAVASIAAPTVELVAHALDSENIAGLLEEAESQGIVEIDGQRLRFAHPLLAHGVYTGAEPARRRAMHRRLAQVVEEPELRARHLALAALSADPVTLKSLDTAAETARIRGAPAAAAELLDRAIKLGGDTPQRRIRSASQHLGVGDTRHAREMLEETIESLPPGRLRAEALSLLGFVRLRDDSPLEAAELLERALGEAEDALALRVQTLNRLSLALVSADRVDDALWISEDAINAATQLGRPHLLSQALGMRAMFGFARGDGLDETCLNRALELEDRQADVPVTRRACMQNAMLLAWTGQLERARPELAAVRRSCVDRGEEGELMIVAFHSVFIEIWRGNFTEATLVAEDAMERALQLGGDVPLCTALAARAALAAYTGHEDHARRDISASLAATQRCGAHVMARWTITALGILEVSLGNYEAAMTALQPLMPRLDAAPNATEINRAWFVPDAVDALVSLGRFDEAEPLVDRLETNGRRLDRAWMLAVGARCRAMLLAAHGEIDAGIVAAQQAMTEHQRLPMPFEHARTQLLLGQLQRRQRHKSLAAATVRQALDTFEELGTPLWAQRARAELARATLDVNRTAELTPSEQRVAELVASGMTNRDVAAALFISAKTVEANLSRIYRKLGIHSRAELGAHIGQARQ